MGDHAKQWYKDWVRDRDALGCQDQISGKNPHTPHYGVNITTGTEFPHTVCQPDTLAGRVDRVDYAAFRDRVLADAQIKGMIRPSDISLSGHPAAEQAMRFECLKIAAAMNPADNTSLMAFAESLLKWVRGH